MDYTVGTLREAGFEAKWGKTRKGAPILFARRPEADAWWIVDGQMWARANEVGFAQAFEEFTALGDFFGLRV